MSDAGALFNAAPCEGVCVGTCVMLVDDKIVYAGPLKHAPKAGGMMILLHSEDFEKLREHVERKRH
jgi:hypothetical protein